MAEETKGQDHSEQTSPTQNTDEELIKKKLQTYSVRGTHYSGRYEKVSPENYGGSEGKSGNLFKGGFYYDCQLEDPFLSMSLHANTRLNENGEWVYWDKVENAKCLSPILDSNDIESAKHYGEEPIARCILSEDFIYSISNDWTDHNTQNPIEGIFSSMKPLAPMLGTFSQGLKKAVSSDSVKNTGSELVDIFNKGADALSKYMATGSNYLNKALYVQGSRYSYFNGSSFNFNNMEMKLLVFSDYVKKENGDWVFQSVEDYIKTLQPYVMGIYNPYNADILDKLGEIGTEAKNFISNFVGFQDPPGGFKMEVKNLDNTMFGTLRLNIGATWAIDNLVLKNMNVSMSKVQAKDPDNPGATVPLYAEISLSLAPASSIIDTKYREMLDHKGLGDIRKSIFNSYKVELDNLKKKMTNK